MNPAARADHDGGAISQLWSGFENRQAGLGHVGDNFSVPDFGEVLFLGIVFRRRARRRAWVEGNDILGGGHGRQEHCQEKGPKEECFHGRVV